MINLSTFNEAIYNISSINNIDYINTNRVTINITEIYYTVAKSLPKSIINLLLISLICFLLYYHILPIWFKYFNDTYNIQHYAFVGGILFLSMALLQLYIYSSPESETFIKLVQLIIGVILYIVVYSIVKYLIDKKVKMDKNGKH